MTEQVKHSETKKDFLLGLFAVCAIIACAFMATLYFQDKGFMGKKMEKAQEYGANNGKALGEVKNDALVKDSPEKGGEPTPEVATPPAEIVVTDEDHARGPKDAKVTIVEYSDFQCPFCSRFHESMQEVMKNYEGKVRWVYRHFPLDSIHPYARQASEATECANDQGKFWEYNDKLFANQQSIAPAYFTTLAKELGLDEKTFGDCLSSGKYKDKVEKQLQEGLAAGVQGTPGNFINGKALRGALPFDMMKVEIDKLLAE